MQKLNSNCKFLFKYFRRASSDCFVRRLLHSHAYFHLQISRDCVWKALGSTEVTYTFVMRRTKSKKIFHYRVLVRAVTVAIVRFLYRRAETRKSAKKERERESAEIVSAEIRGQRYSRVHKFSRQIGISRSNPAILEEWSNKRHSLVYRPADRTRRKLQQLSVHSAKVTRYL